MALLAALAAALPASAEPDFAASEADSETLVDIPDSVLREAVERALGKAAGDPVTRAEMATLIDLRDGNGVRQLTGIEYAVNLVRLSLWSGSISSLEPLASLTSLRYLYLADHEITELGPLSGMTALETLDLFNNAIADVSPLSGLTSLTQLSLGQNAIFDVSPLSGMTALTQLHLSNNAIVDVSPLSGMTALTTLHLTSNAIVDVSPLSGMTALAALGLFNNAIADVSPLSGLTSLTQLSLGQNAIFDVSPLSGMTALTQLHLSNNAIVDVSPLSGMTALTTLHLTSNAIVDVSPLSGMTALAALGLSNNAIADVSPLSGMTALTTLYLSNNAIADASPLARLTSLTQLHLYNNAIADVSPLVANEGLGTGDFVDLQRNFLGETTREEHIPALLQRGVDVLFDTYPFANPTEMPDDVLRLAVNWAVYLARGLEDLATLASLDASNLSIEELAGLEAAAGLRGLFLDRNRITNIAPLSGLDSLQVLTLAHNMVGDLTPLATMESLRVLALDGNSLRDLPSLPRNLQYLYLSDNAISDIGSLADLRRLRELDVGANSISSLGSLGGLGNLQYLHVHDNQVADLSTLNFAPLRELHLRNNAVRDLSPLLAGEELLMVDARRNPLADDALTVLDTLRERRVTVLAGETVPYFPAAGGSRQGFARIVNRSDEDGHVFIEAVDDAGVPARRVRLRLGARQAVHFNSEDLERGNAAIGLGGIGPPTAGDWRLSAISALDIEVLSYVRTEDGFVTAMHDVLPEAMVQFFNPGSNRHQRSILRVVNTEAEPAKWTTGGYDDHGKWRPMAGSLLVRPQHALALTAQALEDVHGLGDGRGKWRLRTRGFPWFAMSLLESPTGHLANLSTAPDNATPLADGATLHRLPLFPAAGGAREGFARVINRSYAAGTVAIEAVDDRGDRFGPLELALRPRRAAHFNATDLEVGNAARGWGGVGGGRGDWRLEVVSELDLTVLAYARTADGFVTSVHDLAPVAADGSHRVVFFNPGSNTRQASRLRLINDGGRAAQVTVAGIDDRGGESGTATLRVPAGAALAFTSAELEAGSDRLAGRLGDGAGKWRLRVRSDEPIAVMSLLETPSGHLTNVSTGTAD